jgi:hypothetical protein
MEEKKMRKWWIGLCALFVTVNFLQAEVEFIQIRWNAFKCLDICTPLIEKNLNAIRNVTNVQINARSGVATMGWSPNYPFSYEPFRLASSAAGIHIDDMRIRIRGTIGHDFDNFYLVSIGDDSRYLLLGPISTVPGRYIPKYNMASYPLSRDTKEQLLEAEKNGLTVVISGPLYLPSRYPHTLIAEQIKINVKESQMDPRFQR